MTPQEQIVKPKRTRADVYNSRVQIRLALDECGPQIAAILAANKIEMPYADFGKIFPHWLIACDRDAMRGSNAEIVGCVMILPAKPFGFVEFLLVKPSVSFKLRAIAVRKLCLQAAATLRVYGSSAVFCTVDDEHKKFADILEKNGMVKVISGNLMMKRLK